MKQVYVVLNVFLNKQLIAQISFLVGSLTPRQHAPKIYYI